MLSLLGGVVFPIHQMASNYIDEQSGTLYPDGNPIDWEIEDLPKSDEEAEAIAAEYMHSREAEYQRHCQNSLYDEF